MMPAVVGVAGRGLPLASVWAAISTATSAAGSAEAAKVGGNRPSMANAVASAARRYAVFCGRIFFIKYFKVVRCVCGPAAGGKPARILSHLGRAAVYR